MHLSIFQERTFSPWKILTNIQIEPDVALKKLTKQNHIKSKKTESNSSILSKEINNMRPCSPSANTFLDVIFSIITIKTKSII
jgi:hypothetical protein